MRAGCSVAAGATYAADGGADSMEADTTEADSTEAGATATEAGAPATESAGAEPPDWRPLIAVTRSPLRILAIPVKPRLPARPWSSASFMELRPPARLSVSSAPLVGTLAR